MVHIVESTRSVKEIERLLPETAKRHQFGVLGTHDLKAKLNEKGLPFENECVVFEVCNPQSAQRVLLQDLGLSTALPCRISVYRDGGKTKIATINPTTLLAMFHAPGLDAVAQQVERDLFAIMDELR